MLHLTDDSLQDEFGTPIHELTFKKTLLSLNKDLIFDLPGNHALWHPNIERWQNIRLPEKHLSSMDRGWLTESDVWSYDPKSRKPIRIIRIGWRTTLSAINSHNLPGLRWTDFCRAFKIAVTDRKVVFLEPGTTDTPMSKASASGIEGWG